MNLTLTVPPPGTCFAFSLDPTFGFALSLKSSFTVSIFLSPPPGSTFLSPPLGAYFSFFAAIFGCALLKSSFLFSIFTLPPPGL
ncbi:hypothetical protein ALC53_09902 [Atta colombica]|uniref:Uncharacterized protein n=1 Tax=Atta colombica TaxID=520822 RepID=A0A151I0Y2_9HYME|nr:hypothetical protein ALC53_09902 [Atta colombica]